MNFYRCSISYRIEDITNSQGPSWINRIGCTVAFYLLTHDFLDLYSDSNLFKVRNFEFHPTQPVNSTWTGTWRDRNQATAWYGSKWLACNLIWFNPIQLVCNLNQFDPSWQGSWVQSISRAELVCAVSWIVST